MISVQKLITEHNAKNGGYFFSHDTLKFFGQRVSDMYILKHLGNKNGRTCYILSALSRKHPKGPTREYYFFDVETFEYIV